MNNLEFCVARRKAERPAFIRVLKAIPESRLDYRPDPKARTAVELAWLLAVEEAALLSLLDTGMVEWKESAPPERLDVIVTAFENTSDQVNSRLEKLDEVGWGKKVRFLMSSGGACRPSCGISRPRRPTSRTS